MVNWLVVAIVALAALGYYALHATTRANGLDDFGAMPLFGLTDQQGRTVVSDALRGHVLVADFIYTGCRDSCPLLSARMQALQDRLRQERLLGGSVELLSFTTDPARDTVPVLRTYAEQHDADPDAWHFLTGPSQYLLPVITRGFHLAAQAVPVVDASAPRAGDYDVMHSNTFVLVDRLGHVRAYYDGATIDASQIVHDVHRLLK